MTPQPRKDVPKKKDDIDASSDVEDEKESSEPKVVIKKPAAKIACKRPAAALFEDSPAAEVLGARKTIANYPFAMKQLRSLKKRKGRPMIPKSGKLVTSHYMSGHIYPKYKGSPVMRVFARKGDRHEQRVPYDPKDKKDVENQWSLACAIIESDPRDVAE